jgi:predicted  nucleic acid-binding Zn-ribbon protein
MSDSVQIRCTRCRCHFRDRARRIQSGYSKQCPNCEVLIFFEEGSNDANVRAALLAARKLRRVLHELDAAPRPARGLRRR